MDHSSRRDVERERSYQQLESHHMLRPLLSGGRRTTDDTFMRQYRGIETSRAEFDLLLQEK
jgi:hypothetical protein